MNPPANESAECIDLAPAVRLAAAFFTGVAACGAAVSAWAVLHGTSLSDVFYAMYPFRLAAGQVLSSSGNSAPATRLGQLGIAWIVSGMALAAGVVVWWAFSKRSARTGVVAGLIGLMVFDVVSIILGGNFWLHYLMQLVVPASVLLGVAAGRRECAARMVVGVVVLATLISLVGSGALLPGVHRTESSTLGRAVRDAAEPGDSLVTLYGHSDVSQQSGLSSPYPYLWSLPLKTLDPDLRRLDAVLTGPQAPAWVITWAHVSSWGVRSSATSNILLRDYRVAGVLKGHTVYLRNDLRRPSPVWPVVLPSSDLSD